MGNSNSVLKAFHRVGVQAFISSNPNDLNEAEKIVLPGVGAFGKAIKNLKDLQLIDPLKKNIIDNKKPFLGICLGMQLTAEISTEMGKYKGLHWIDKSKVTKFNFNNHKLKIPHIGWNEITFQKNNPLFNNIKQNSDFYFVHSYHYHCSKKYASSTCFYGYNFISSIQKDNIHAVQFHPEKSQNIGLQLLENFTKLC